MADVWCSGTTPDSDGTNLVGHGYKSQLHRKQHLSFDTRTIGKAPSFTGEHKDWSEWSFQLTDYMGSANPKSIEALQWPAMEKNPAVNRCRRDAWIPGLQHSAVSCLGTPVQGQCAGDRGEDGNQQWAGSVAWIERCV